MVTETDTVTVLFTTIFQELHQLADEFLQLIEVQPVATPVAQQVNQVIVTTTIIVPPPSAGPVGGVVEPVNKLTVAAPYLALFGVIAAVAVVVWKKREN